MVCAVLGCHEGDELTTNPCSVCGKPTHHLCAVDVFEGPNSAINERFCSQSCVQVVYPSANTHSFVEERDTKRRKTATAPTSNTNTYLAKRKKNEVIPVGSNVSIPSHLPTTPSSPPASPVSDLGVPLSIKHSRKVGTSDDVWDLIHHLEKPYRKRNPWKSSKTIYHNICVLCCENIKARSKTNRYSWEEALRTTKNTTNAKDHIKAKHAEHPLAVLADMKITQKSMTDVINAETDITALTDSTEKAESVCSSSVARITSLEPTTTTETFVGSKSGKSSKRFFRANEKVLNVLISKWLITQGLPYTVASFNSFQDVIRAATGNPTYPVLSRDRHDRLLNGQFQLFCDLVGDLITSEFETVCKLKFLNLMHDIWTTCGKDSIVGASVAFIDSSWRFRFIAMLACVKNDGHNAPLVAKVIESGFKAKYNLDIRDMTRFTMSDTTPSAKNVADHIGTEQEDCAMHLLNLCIGYGLGLKDNIQTVTIWNESKNAWEKVVRTVTPGGALDEGGDVIQKLRNLNNHFKSSKQRDALSKIQEALSYPDLDPLTDMDVRVAYTCKLIRRSVVNYAAFQAYFSSTSDSLSVWTALTAKHWMLAAEMEAVTNFIASLAIVEAQSENLVASYMVVFRRLAENKLKSFKFETMAIEAPRSRDSNEASHRRVTRTLDQFSDAGKTCLKRTLLQLQSRFPKVMKEAMACILLDPRTKSSAKRIAAVGNIPRKEEKAIYNSGLDYLREEHRKVFSKMTKEGKIPLIQPSSQNSLLSQDLASPISSPASTGWDDEDELLFGAPIRARKTRDEVKESEMNARADGIMREWLELEPEWLDVAQRQNPEITKADLTKDMSIDAHSGMYWALLGLYKHVDVLRWFRDEGQALFPSIALLARIHLGKISSSAFQERVFSTGGMVMGPLRTRTDSRRSEKQLLLRHNRDEIVQLKQDAAKRKAASRSAE